METTIGLIVVACACLVVGIYFFFVRTRPSDNLHDSQ